MKVLLATDGSKYAQEAAGFLARLPHPEKLELIVLTIAPTVEFHGSIEVEEWMKRNAAAEKDKAQLSCQQIERMFEGADATVESVVVEGHVGETIVEMAEARQVELVVIGAVGTSSVERLMLGSVSDFVATHASCSVLVVRPNPEHEKLRELSICIADDESPPSEFAIEQLSSFGWGGHTKIDLVNVMLLPLTYTDVPINLDTESLRHDMLEILDKRIEHVKRLSPHVKTHVIEASHIGEGIVEFAKRHQNNLIVAGSTGRGLLARFLLGSVSKYILRHAHCSVWIARRGK